MPILQSAGDIIVNVGKSVRPPKMSTKNVVVLKGKVGIIFTVVISVIIIGAIIAFVVMNQNNKTNQNKKNN